MIRIDEEAIASLPEPVQRSLRHSGVVGTVVPSRVAVRQRGRIRTAPDSRWLTFRAHEEYGVDDASFTWNAGLRIAGLTLGRATDSLSAGRGRMHVRLLGRFDVVDASGPEVDQGSAMRWLNETMWFPAVWATDRIAWKPVDDHRAIGSMRVSDLSIRAEFQFDDDGRLVDFIADRYRGDGEDAELTPWRTPITGYRTFSGIDVPSAGMAVWDLADGPFVYIEIAVDDIRYETAEA